MKLYYFNDKGGEILAREAIEKIKLAEDEASRLVSEAQMKSRELLKEAEAQVKLNDANIMEEARRLAEEIKSKAKLDAEHSVQSVLEEGKASVNAILSIEDAQVEKAASAILERIVKTNGNR